MLIVTLQSYVDDCKKPSVKHRYSPYLRFRDKSDTMTGSIMPFHWIQLT